jgi:hypothetical protein
MKGFPLVWIPRNARWQIIGRLEHDVEEADMILKALSREEIDIVPFTHHIEFEEILELFRLVHK